jgi:hypothetical protein
MGHQYGYNAPERVSSSPTKSLNSRMEEDPYPSQNTGGMSMINVRRIHSLF